MAATDEDVKGAARQMTGMWGWFLFTGILWVLIAFVVLRFNLESTVAVGIIVGFVLVFAGMNEFMAGYAAKTWKWVHYVLGVLFVLGGFYALVQPASAFLALASLVSFFLLLKGTIDIIMSIMEKDVVPVWWLQLVAGIIEILLGFWAAESATKQIALLILWVGAMCLVRGVTEIAFAFKMRSVHKEMGAA